jgi:hypothetical protein
MSKGISPYLLAANAVWDDGPEAGRWIEDRLGPFGCSVGHAVPLGYPAYAVVPLVGDDDSQADDGSIPILEAVLDVLDRFTGDQPVHCGMWDGWGWWYAPGEDPRTAPGTGVMVYWPETHQPAQKEIDRALTDPRESLAIDRVQYPRAKSLNLPARSYYLWTGPLRSALAFRHLHDLPSLIWPEDHSWFVGAPIYTNEIAIAGTSTVVDALIADPLLNAYRVTQDDDLDIDD